MGSIINPVKIAGLILKINILLFGITLFANFLGLFPFYMHAVQISNYIAMDVMNDGYVTESNVVNYIKHFDAVSGDADANSFSLMTFQETAGTDVSGGKSLLTAGINGSGNQVFIEKLTPVDGLNGSIKNAAVAVQQLSTAGVPIGKSAIIKVPGGNLFEPKTNPDQALKAYNGTLYSGQFGYLMQRGQAYRVTLQTRYQLSAGGFGFFFHTAIPVNAESVGVSTQYYKFN